MLSWWSYGAGAGLVLGYTSAVVDPSKFCYLHLQGNDIGTPKRTNVLILVL